MDDSNLTLPYAINLLKRAGYRMVSVAECLGQNPYRTIGPPGVRAVSWAFLMVFSGLTFLTGRLTGCAERRFAALCFL
jgi:hypothetical protein